MAKSTYWPVMALQKNQEELYKKGVTLLERSFNSPLSEIKFDLSNIERTIICQDGEEIIGTLILGTGNKKRFVAIKLLGVEPNLKRNNIGTSLLVSAEKIAYERGYEGSYVLTHKGLTEWYTKRGYSIQQKFQDSRLLVKPFN